MWSGQVGKAPDFESGERRFEPCLHNQRKYMVAYPEVDEGLDCDSSESRFESGRSPQNDVGWKLNGWSIWLRTRRVRVQVPRIPPGVKRTKTGCGLVWLKRLVWNQEIVGSNPAALTNEQEGELARASLNQHLGLSVRRGDGAGL